MTLERIEHKVFASEAPLDEMGQFGSALATTKLNTKDVAEIQALPAYTQGWGSAIISENNYPAMEEMNGVLNVMSYHTGYLYQEGIPVYSSTQTYSATSWVKDLAGSKMYKSLKDNNTGNALSNTEWWTEFGYVEKSGDTMTGALVFDKNSDIEAIKIKTDNVLGSVGEPLQDIAYYNNGIRIGKIRGTYNPSAHQTSLLTILYDNETDTSKGTVSLSYNPTDGTTFEFPRCTTKATTTSSASNGKVAVVVQNYVNGTSWYRVWSDGWKEQGGLAVTHESDKRYTTVTFLKAFSNTNYTVVCSGLQSAMSNSDYGHVYSRTATSVRFNSAQSDADIFWYACGY